MSFLIMKLSSYLRIGYVVYRGWGKLKLPGFLFNMTQISEWSQGMLYLCTVRSTWFVTLSNGHRPSFCSWRDDRKVTIGRTLPTFLCQLHSQWWTVIQSSFSLFTFILDWNNGRAFHGKHRVCPQYPQAHRTNKLCPEYLFLPMEHLVHLGDGFPRRQGQHWTPDGQSKLL